MSEIAKSPSASHPLAARGKLYRAAVVGAASLKGKEVAEMLNERNFPAADIRLLDDDESMGQLEAMGDEVSFIQRVRAEQFENVDFTFFASDEQTTRKNWKDARDAGSAIIDLSASLESEHGASVRSLWIERERGQRWHWFCCEQRKRARFAARWPRFSNLLPNMGSGGWMSCISRP